MLPITCPGCRKALHAAETATDRDSQCPACGAVFRPDRVMTRVDAHDRSSKPLTPRVLSRPSDAALVSEDGQPWPDHARSVGLARFDIGEGFLARHGWKLVFVGLWLASFALFRPRYLWPQNVVISLVVAGASTLALIVLYQFIGALREVMNGLRKAAGRPTIRRRSSKRSDPPYNENLP